MSGADNWLEQVWEIKRKLAEKYAGVPTDVMLRDMHEHVVAECAKHGWTLKYADFPQQTQAPHKS